jgi:hypothetical protein
MQTYVVFPFFGNLDLKKTLIQRAIQLGYKQLSFNSTYWRTVTLDTKNGNIIYTSFREDNNYEDNPFHETGDMLAFFSTDRYKFSKFLIVDDWKVTKYKDNSGIKMEKEGERNIIIQDFQLKKMAELLYDVGEKLSDDKPDEPYEPF